ncbi:MAG: response regulator [Nitrospiraceae bacterium]|nr:response regulator [Nitrospiraceae bacterium]
MNVLVVDDNAVFTGQLKKYLTARNISVDTAGGGRSAIELMERRSYDVVVLDLKMPDLPGVDVLRWARSHGVQSKFIILTGYGDIKTAVETMKLGADDYVQKPFKAEKLFNLLKEVVGRKHLSADSFPTGDSKDWIKLVCMNRHILLVTETNPVEIEKEYGITSTKSVWLKDNLRENVLGVTKFTMIERAIEKFTDEYLNAAVIHGGISRLRDIYGDDSFHDYMSRIFSMAKDRGFRLVILYKSSDEKKAIQTAQEIPFFLNIEEISRVLGSAARCSIIRVLDERKALRYSELMKETNIGLSSDIAFHIRKLTEWEVVSKKGESYAITPRGHYFANILNMLLDGEYRDPASNIMYCRL